MRTKRSAAEKKKHSRIVVSFATPPDRVDQRPFWAPPRGGCGLHNAPPPFAGPVTRIVPASQRVFVVTHVDRSPTGSAHGSFLIQEKVNDRLIIRGYHCSWPDEDVCVKIAKEDESNRRIGYQPPLATKNRRIQKFD